MYVHELTRSPRDRLRPHLVTDQPQSPELDTLTATIKAELLIPTT